MKVKRRYIIVAVLLLVLLGLWFWFSQHSKQQQLDTVLVKSGSMVKTVTAVGDVHPGQLVDVGSQASGQVKKLHVKLGQQLQQGDLIAEIDASAQINEVQLLQARLKTYNAQLVAATITHRLAQQQYEREVELFAAKATAKVSLETMQEKLALAQAKLVELNSLIEQIQVELNTAKLNLSYTKIVAPIAGTVVFIAVEEGKTVNAMQTTPTIAQVAQLDQMQIKIRISEVDAVNVKAGMAVSYTTLDDPTNVKSARLESIDPATSLMTDSGIATNENQAVYYYGRVLVPNLDAKLRIGMTTQNTIEVAKVEDALLLPLDAVYDVGTEKAVMLLDPNKQQPLRRMVRTGLSDNTQIQILDGLQVGEEVILDEKVRLTE